MRISLRYVLSLSAVVGRVGPGRRAGAGHGGADRAGGRRASELADPQWRLRQQALQPAHSDHARQREEPRTEMGAAGSGVRRLGIEPARRRRHHVRDRTAERCDRPRCEDRQGLLALPLHAVAGRPRLLRRQQPRRRDAGRHAVHGHARRASDRDRCEKRPAALEHRGGGRQARLFDHHGAAGRERQSHRRRRRRRVRHPRVRRSLRCENREGSLALQHHSRTGRAGTRDLERR